MKTGEFVSIGLEELDLDLSPEAIQMLLRMRRRAWERETDGFISDAAVTGIAAEYCMKRGSSERILRELASKSVVVRELSTGRNGWLDVRYVALHQSHSERQRLRAKWREAKRPKSRSQDQTGPISTVESEAESHDDSTQESGVERPANSTVESTVERPNFPPRIPRYESESKKEKESLHSSLGSNAGASPPDHAPTPSPAAEAADSVETRRRVTQVVDWFCDHRGLRSLPRRDRDAAYSLARSALPTADLLHALEQLWRRATSPTDPDDDPRPGPATLRYFHRPIQDAESAWLKAQLPRNGHSTEPTSFGDVLASLSLPVGGDE